LRVLRAATPIFAHHSNAAICDADKRTVIKGEVTKVQWTNPHSYIYLDVKDAGGNVVNWALEDSRRTRSSNRLANQHDQGR
jgi:hypothetical protein